MSERIDQARDDLILATAVALERLIETAVAMVPQRTSIETHILTAQGRLIATITQFSAAKEGKS